MQASEIFFRDAAATRLRFMIKAGSELRSCPKPHHNINHKTTNARAQSGRLTNSIPEEKVCKREGVVRCDISVRPFTRGVREDGSIFLDTTRVVESERVPFVVRGRPKANLGLCRG